MIGGPPQDLAAWAPPGKPRRRAGRIVFWVLVGLSFCLVVAGVVLSGLTTRNYTDPSAAMEKTIQPGDHMRVALGRDVRRGDIVVFHVPAMSPGHGGSAVKRLIGLPGDHVTCCNSSGQVTVDGKPIDETYLDPAGPPSRIKFSVTLRPGQVWVMGDNRNVSLDSRGYGPVAASGIVGRVSAIGHVLPTTTIRTPTAFVAAGLAPPDQRPGPYVYVAPLILVGVVALIVLAIVGIIRFVIRRSRARRNRPRGYAAYGSP